MSNNNQNLYKKRDALYRIQAKLAGQLSEKEREALLAQKKKLEAELAQAVVKNSPDRQYCIDHKCSEMKQLKHVRHLQESPNPETV
ncbi:MAG: hypothetical protein K2Y22_06295 [Candidatus Obscuribacterales bacterium]|nr:hypothetical protein [Candidatus Obscuribacterales bacterium]